MEGFLSHKIGEDERKFFYGTYALGKTLNHFGYSISDLGDPDTPIKVDDFDFFVVFTFHAAAFVRLRDEQLVDFNLMNVYEWIDISGGIKGDFVRVGLTTMNASMGLKINPEASEAVTQKKSKKKNP